LKRAPAALLATVLGVTVIGVGCAVQPSRTFYDDRDATDGTAPGDATATADGRLDGSGVDASTDGEDGRAPDAFPDAPSGADAADAQSEAGHDAGNDAAADAANDAAADAGNDAAVDAGNDAEAGCGPTNTVANCTACGSACDSVHSLGASCNGASCNYSGCAAGWADCVTTGPPNTDGCETALNTVSNCTGCGLTCDSAHSLSRSCDGTTCRYSGCAPGYGDCINTGPPDTDGCETALNTTSNCTGCGLACDAAHSVGTSCAGNGCAYTGCAAGWSNCSTAAPDVAGCECNTPACCGTSCQTTHDNGVGNSYYDCLTAGTYTLAQAMKACTAYTGNASQCVQFTCVTATDGPIVCSTGAMTQNCICWSYGGNNVGNADNAGGPPGRFGNNCFCPSTPDLPWN
jgi:hypothetical protein